MKYARTYHSSVILLADGSVLAGGDPQTMGAPTAHERFLPGYFFMPRPEITGTPASIGYGVTLNIDSPLFVEGGQECLTESKH